MLELHQFPRNKTTINDSPFCLKLETFLKITNLPYKAVYGVSSSRNPKKKMPFLIDDNKIIPDTFFCMEYLTKKHGLNLDAHLNADQKALGWAVTRMLEDGLFFNLVYFRWIDPNSWPHFRAAIFSKLTLPLKLVIPPVLQNRVKKHLKIQGVGLHSGDEIFEIAKRDIESAANLLGEKNFLLGEKISSFDASFFGFVNNLLYCRSQNPLTFYGQKYLNLTQYCQRMRDTFFH